MMNACGRACSAGGLDFLDLRFHGSGLEQGPGADEHEADAGDVLQGVGLT
jgi:hypothetical protein